MNHAITESGTILYLRSPGRGRPPQITFASPAVLDPALVRRASDSVLAGCVLGGLLGDRLAEKRAAAVRYLRARNIYAIDEGREFDYVPARLQHEAGIVYLRNPQLRTLLPVRMGGLR